VLADDFTAIEAGEGSEIMMASRAVLNTLAASWSFSSACLRTVMS